METRANTLVIGSFVLAVIASMFIFTFWLMSSSEGTEKRDIKVVFPGAVTGLPKGGSVLFNGIKIGDVTNLTFDPTNPKLVIATVRVDVSTPLRKDSVATLGFTGLTGVAYVDLTGGSQLAEPLFDAEDDEVPVIYAQRSQFEDLLQGAKDILRKADQTLGNIDVLVADSKPDIKRGIQNFAKFSDALAANSDGVRSFMGNISDTSKAITDLSGRIGNLVDRGEVLLANVPPDKLGKIVENTETLTADLAKSGTGINEAVTDIKKATKQFDRFGEGLNKSLSGVDQILTAVKPEQVQDVMAGAASLGKLMKSREREMDEIVVSSRDITRDAAAVTAEVAGEKGRFKNILKNTDEAVVNVRDAATNISGISQAVDQNKLSNIIGDIEQVTASLAGKSGKVEQALDDFASAAQSVDTLASGVAERKGDIDQVITDAKHVSGNLSKASDKLDGLMTSVDGMVNSEGGQGLIGEATKAFEAIRKVAEKLDESIGPITTNLRRFSAKGPSEFSAAMQQLSRTLKEIERAAANFDRNPNRVIFGGEDTPVFNGPKRR
ncbi:MlaD family protein [Polycladidibacter stylochi]|uniref:MlaD family protein n=1 Tax=Polycladidibacter stylochi TaxID=1807766 RepID=UPI00082F1FEF|nr:MlaD family protein [Pseudovibrio stylochi]